MPYINTTTTKQISKDQQQQLVKAFGEAITLIPGKSEAWLMLNFRGEANMAFKGDSYTDCAMLEVEIFGKAKSSDLERLTKQLCDDVTRILSVPSDRIYVKYREVDVWGYNGFNF